ncbi:MAG: MlaD family protein [Spirochaetaceae bacterium]|jgi:phospholipid/cholesterol/gamma-HCH transport system substrate-binding protein|nr:MlaD family protein [Spirochaetaceae bacterium]
MRFRIRFVDQLVGIFIIIALLLVIFVIFMLGSHQRWFARDYLFKAYFDSALGLNPNMAVQYKGFTIGSIKAVALTEQDTVEVTIAIFDSYVDRVREGSLVELVVSPIGLGNQFRFYSGLGSRLLEEGETLPTINSPEGKALTVRGLTNVPLHEDSVNLILSRANTLLDSINTLVLRIQGAVEGERETSLGRIMGNAEETAGSVSILADELRVSLEGILLDVQPIIGNLEALSNTLADPEGLISTVLDTQGTVYTNLESSLKSITAILRNLEKISGFVPTQLPGIAGTLEELREAVASAQDVLIALLNNPLLRKGVPERVQTQTFGTDSRDVTF